MQPADALFRRALADARVRTICFGAFFALYGLAQSAGYKKAFPTVADRVNFASNFSNDAGLRLFYGTPHHVETVGGYVAWRVGGVTALVAAFFGLLCATRAFRGEEDSGRFEIVLAGAITRQTAFLARLASVLLTLAALWLALALGIAAGGLSPGDSAFLALGVASVAAVYLGVGLIAGELLPSGGATLELGGAVFGLDFLLRVVADVGNHPGLHWFTPLGWAEEMRAFSNPRPLVLLLPLVTASALIGIGIAINCRRDVGAAVFAPHDTTRRPRLRLLRSATSLAMRLRAIGLAGWLVATAVFAVVLGTLAQSVISGLTPSIREELAKFGLGQLTTADGVLGLYFLLFVLEIALFCCSQIDSTRGEEAAGRLEMLFALPQERMAWLGGQLALAVVGAVLLALTAGVGAAIGATAAGASVSVAKLVGAGLNCLPVSALFLGLGALAFAVFPRQSTGLAYGLVSVTFVWYLVAALLDVPGWLVGVSPFDQIGFVPAAPFRAGPAAIMVAIGVAAAAAALIRFRRRDLVGV